jgi:diguanylate cyclase (GGDEF)-like protein
LHTHNTHLVLNKLIALTNERDVVALELSLAQSLFDLIASFNANIANAVVIYRAIDIRKQLFSAEVIGQGIREGDFSAKLRQVLTDCFKSGEYNTYVQEGESRVALYPLSNAAGHTMTIIAIENFICDLQQHKTITMLLQIYQNFTGLINDNERDTLTGLLNRKTFEYKINKILEYMQNTAKRKNDKTNQLHYLAIFDIDHFKRVNDEFGHLIGDEVLLLFSQFIVQKFRSTDPLFRFGGEEFVAVFECASHADILNILERFREKVENFNFPQVGKVTVSAGYTDISANDASTSLIDRADAALYFAKNNGRNQVSHYEQLVAQGALQESKKEGDIELF